MVIGVDPAFSPGCAGTGVRSPNTSSEVPHSPSSPALGVDVKIVVQVGSTVASRTTPAMLPTHDEVRVAFDARNVESRFGSITIELLIAAVEPNP